MWVSTYCVYGNNWRAIRIYCIAFLWTCNILFYSRYSSANKLSLFVSYLASSIARPPSIARRNNLQDSSNIVGGKHNVFLSINPLIIRIHKSIHWIPSSFLLFCYISYSNVFFNVVHGIFPCYGKNNPRRWSKCSTLRVPFHGTLQNYTQPGSTIQHIWEIMVSKGNHPHLWPKHSG